MGIKLFTIAHDTKEAALFGLDMEMGTGTDGLTSTLKNAYDNYYLAHPFLQMIKNIGGKYVNDSIDIIRIAF